MAITINKEMCIIHEKYVVMFLQTHASLYLNSITIYEMAMRINMEMRIIHEKYVVMFLQTHT